MTSPMRKRCIDLKKINEVTMDEKKYYHNSDTS